MAIPQSCCHRQIPERSEHLPRQVFADGYPAKQFVPNALRANELFLVQRKLNSNQAIADAAHGHRASGTEADHAREGLVGQWSLFANQAPEEAFVVSGGAGHDVQRRRSAGGEAVRCSNGFSHMLIREWLLELGHRDVRPPFLAANRVSAALPAEASWQASEGREV